MRIILPKANRSFVVWEPKSWTDLSSPPSKTLFCCSLFEQEQKQKPSWSFVVSNRQICLYSASLRMTVWSLQRL
nr:hypothetical protein CFP56_02137 [Quercus suber]